MESGTKGDREEAGRVRGLATITLIATVALAASVLSITVSPPHASASPPVVTPLLAQYENSSRAVSRDGGFSVALPDGRDLWLFGDTVIFTNNGAGLVPSGFISGNTAAEGAYAAGQVPTSLLEVNSPSQPLSLSPNNPPAQFLPTPSDVYLPDGSGNLCTSVPGRYSARWIMGAAVIPNTSDVLITYSDVCVTGSFKFRGEGWGFAEYNWKTNAFDVGPDDVVLPQSSGAELAPSLELGNPVFNGTDVTLFSFNCTSAFVACASGQVYAATLPATVAALSQAASYAVNPVATDASTTWQPFNIAVAGYADTPLRMIETTDIAGSYDVLTASTAAGPWHLETTGVVPDCQALTSGFCYALIGHPELSTASQLVISYYDPGAGPAGPTGPVGHLLGVGTSYTEAVPLAPQDLSAVAGTTSAQLTWSPPQPNGAGPVKYNIYRSTLPGREMSNFAAPIATGVTATTYTDSGLAPSASAYYVVTAVNSLGFEGLASVETAVIRPTLLQRHADGSIWQYGGPPVAGWSELDNNPATADMVTDGANIYQLHGDGTIWQYVTPPIRGWVLLDDNPATVQIAASGGNLYQRRRDGSIWQYGGPPLTGWSELDANPATVSIAADGANLYQRHGDGTIWQYVTPPIRGWALLDNNQATVQIAASGGNLYQWHGDGTIWHYAGTPVTGWALLDNNPATVGVVADGPSLYQLHGDGTIWQYVTPPIRGWALLDNNPATVGITAGDGSLFELHGGGRIWQYVTPPIRGWALLDNNPATDLIASSSPPIFLLP